MNWFLFWLVLHVLAAVIGFGPIFAFPFIGVLSERRPAAAHFAAELSHLMGTKLVAPVASTMLISGLGLVYTASINMLKTPYLLVSLILYLAVMAGAFAHQAPNGARIVELSTQSPAPPELAARVARQRSVGIAMTAGILVILVLMVLKPGGITLT